MSDKTNYGDDDDDRDDDEYKFFKNFNNYNLKDIFDYHNQFLKRDKKLIDTVEGFKSIPDSQNIVDKLVSIGDDETVTLNILTFHLNPTYTLKPNKSKDIKNQNQNIYNYQDLLEENTNINNANDHESNLSSIIMYYTLFDNKKINENYDFIFDIVATYYDNVINRQYHAQFIFYILLNAHITQKKFKKVEIIKYIDDLQNNIKFETKEKVTININQFQILKYFEKITPKSATNNILKNSREQIINIYINYYKGILELYNLGYIINLFIFCSYTFTFSQYFDITILINKFDKSTTKYFITMYQNLNELNNLSINAEKYIKYVNTKKIIRYLINKFDININVQQIKKDINESSYKGLIGLKSYIVELYRKKLSEYIEKGFFINPSESKLIEEVDKILTLPQITSPESSSASSSASSASSSSSSASAQLGSESESRIGTVGYVASQQSSSVSSDYSSVEEELEGKKKARGLYGEGFERRFDYPPSVRTFIKEHGDKNIYDILVCRRPIWRTIQYAMNVLSLGTMTKKMKQQKFDKLFHTFFVIRFANDTNRYFIEKNEVVTFGRYIQDKSDRFVIIKPKIQISLRNFLYNPVVKYGQKIYEYDPISANCQIFVLNVLDVNGLLTEHIKNFVYQDVDKVLSGYTYEISRLITKFANRFDTLIHGKALEQNDNNILL